MKPRLTPPIPPKRSTAVTFDSASEARRRLINSEFCEKCGKLRLATKAEAHSYIGLMLSKSVCLKRGSHTLAPYRCPIKGWHVGRDRKAAELLETKQ